jgi:hypothetical protein
MNISVDVDTLRQIQLGSKDDALVVSALEVASDLYQCLLVRQLWGEVVSRALRNGESEIRSGVSLKILWHTNYRRIVEDTVWRITIYILWQYAACSQSSSWGKLLVFQCFLDSFDEANRNGHHCWK